MPTHLPKGTIIAIDGPSGAGKSSLSKAIASKYDTKYLDTGAIYRAFTLWCLNNDVNLADETLVAQKFTDFPFETNLNPVEPKFYLGQEDITAKIRTAKITANVSRIATNLKVRWQLQDLQRQITKNAASEASIVLEGRDTTTVIVPDASIRILLIASESARLARRATENFGHADEETIAATSSEIIDRDAKDATVSTFFQASQGATTIDSSTLNLAETIALAEEIIWAKINEEN